MALNRVDPARSEASGVSEVRGGPRCLAIASGKGGVGKTWFAISVATSLARQGSRVLLVDGDLGLANVDVQLGLVPEFDLGAIVERDLPLVQAVTRCPTIGFDVLAGKAGSGALSALSGVALERLLLMLSEQRQYDMILLDLGAGVDRSVRRMACWADSLLVLATDEPTSLTDSYVVLKLHLQDKDRLGRGRQLKASVDARIVINQAASLLAGEQTYRTLSRVSASYLDFTPALAGIIRRDDRVRDAIRSQVPLPLRYPVSQAAQDVERIASGLVRCEGQSGSDSVLQH